MERPSAIEPSLRRMFPLGSVLLPSAPLQLHVFEPRYQILLNETLEDDRSFGVALIVRGHEVGGGDERAMVGTLARVEAFSRFDDGRAALVARGQERIRITDWVSDDPYPQALVATMVDPPPVADDRNLLDSVMQALGSMLDAARRTGRVQGNPERSWPDDPVRASWELADALPIGSLDKQAILEAVSVAERLELLGDRIRDLTEDLRLLEELE